MKLDGGIKVIGIDHATNLETETLTIKFIVDEASGNNCNIILTKDIAQTINKLTQEFISMLEVKKEYY